MTNRWVEYVVGGAGGLIWWTGPSAIAGILSAAPVWLFVDERLASIVALAVGVLVWLIGAVLIIGSGYRETIGRGR